MRPLQWALGVNFLALGARQDRRANTARQLHRHQGRRFKRHEMNQCGRTGDEPRRGARCPRARTTRCSRPSTRRTSPFRSGAQHPCCAVEQILFNYMALIRKHWDGQAGSLDHAGAGEDPRRHSRACSAGSPGRRDGLWNHESTDGTGSRGIQGHEDEKLSGAFCGGRVDLPLQ